MKTYLPILALLLCASSSPAGYMKLLVVVKTIDPDKGRLVALDPFGQEDTYRIGNDTQVFSYGTDKPVGFRYVKAGDIVLLLYLDSKKPISVARIYRGGGRKDMPVVGNIKKVDLEEHSLVVANESGREVTVTINPAMPPALQNIQSIKGVRAGDRVRLLCRLSGEKRFATQLTVSPEERVVGSVTKVDREKGVVDITDESGRKFIFSVSPTLAIYSLGAAGRAVSSGLGELKVGQDVEAVYREHRDGRREILRLATGHREMRGTVKSLDPHKNALLIDDSQGHGRAFFIHSGTDVLATGGKSKIVLIKPGARVKVLFDDDPDTMLRVARQIVQLAAGD